MVIVSILLSILNMAKDSKKQENNAPNHNHAEEPRKKRKRKSKGENKLDS